MAKRISKSEAIDQINGNIIYTVPALATATISNINITPTNVDTVITVSSFVDATGVITTYTADLKVGDIFTDFESYMLAAGDYIKVESTAPASYRAFVELP